MSVIGQGAAILVLEDEAVVAMELEVRLSQLGYRVLGPVASVAAARELALRERPDLLLADIRLRGEPDGIEAAAVLRHELGIPTVYLSAYADGETVQRAMAADPFGYLTKPMRESELHATIKTALHRDRLEKALAQRERDLKASEARFRAVFQGSPDGLLLVTRSGAIRLANAASEWLFGYAIEELTRMSVDDLVPASVRRHHVDLRASFAEQRKMRLMGSGGVVYGLTKQGEEIPLEIGLSQAPLDSEECFIVAVRDISERLRKDDEIRKLASAVHHASECISLCKLDGTLVFLNEAGARMLGVNPARASEHKIGDMIPEQLLSRVETEIVPKLLAGGTWEGELTYKNIATGVLTDVYCTSFSIADPISGEASLLACVSLDITAKKRAELELEKSRVALAQSQKLDAIGRLASGIAHDFNNLLTVILGAGRLLERHLSTEPRLSGLVHDIGEAGDRAKHLIDQLLAFARQKPSEPRIVDINAQIYGFSGLLSRSLGPRIELRLDLGVGASPVLIDPLELDRILLNLGVNAREAMPDGGVLTIRTSRASGVNNRPGFIIEVEDHGVGMSEETQAQIFEPFFTTRPFGEGTGLGLSTVYGLVSQAKGEISVRSQVGVGTVFRVWLPAEDQERIALSFGLDGTSGVHAVRGTALDVEEEQGV